ncbi:hypothetical protein Nepgr_033855 [Nepenthes gracilis]|uniref:Uncharacterized protein n=1 Tax=Nepenthes gracilis TaxID=150966 RepID=A0AAD3Y955_NEPGR|nr:hypothetical protein Nepgr_033855 [Nepenthes gracilis]
MNLLPDGSVGLGCMVFSVLCICAQGLEAPGNGTPDMLKTLEWGAVGLGAYISVFVQLLLDCAEFCLIHIRIILRCTATGSGFSAGQTAHASDKISPRVYHQRMSSNSSKKSALRSISQHQNSASKKTAVAAPFSQPPHQTGVHHPCIQDKLDTGQDSSSIATSSASARKDSSSIKSKVSNHKRQYGGSGIERLYRSNS